MRRLALFGLAAVALLLPARASAQQESPPTPGAPRDFRLPPSRTLTLPNGMGVTFIPFGAVPKVTVNLALRTGRIDEPADRVWLAALVGDYLNEGTTTRTAQALAEEMAAMGGSLGVGVGSDQMSISADVLAERAADLVRVIADVVRNPAFPESELARLRASRLRTLAIQRSQPQPLASERFLQITFGDHPYGRSFPTEEMLQGFTIDQVRAFHAANVGARRAHLYVAGVFDAQAVERAIRDAFGDWAGGPAPSERPARPAGGRRVELIDRPDAPQSTIYFGLPVAAPGHADWIPLAVTNALLGGAFGSRITTNIREEKGYTYSPFSTVSARRGAAFWAEIADVTTDVTGASLTEIIGEIDRLRREAPPADELDGIKKNMAGIFVIQNSSRGGLIGQLQFTRLHGLGDDYVQTYTRRVMAVTPEQVRATAERWLDPSQMALVAVGDLSKIEEQLARFRGVVP